MDIPLAADCTRYLQEAVNLWNEAAVPEEATYAELLTARVLDRVRLCPTSCSRHSRSSERCHATDCRRH